MRELPCHHVFVCWFATGNTGDSLFQIQTIRFFQISIGLGEAGCSLCADGVHLRHPVTSGIVWFPWRHRCNIAIPNVGICCNYTICCVLCNLVVHPLAALALWLGTECKTLNEVLPIIPSWHHKSSTWILKCLNWNPESASYLCLKYRMHFQFVVCSAIPAESEPDLFQPRWYQPCFGFESTSRQNLSAQAWPIFVMCKFSCQFI